MAAPSSPDIGDTQDSGVLLFHGRRPITPDQFNDPIQHGWVAAELVAESHRMPVALRQSLFGVEAVMLTERPQAGPTTFVFQIRIFDVQLCKSRGDMFVVVVKEVPPGANPVIGYALYALTARNEADAASVCQTCMRMSQRWHHQGNQVVSRNLSSAQLKNPLVGQIAAKFGKLPVQVLIRWLISKWSAHEGTLVLPRSASPHRVLQLIGAEAWEFDQEDMAKLAVLANDFRYQALNPKKKKLVLPVAVKTVPVPEPVKPPVSGALRGWRSSASAGAGQPNPANSHRFSSHVSFSDTPQQEFKLGDGLEIVPLKERIRRLSAASAVTDESEPWNNQTSFSGGASPREAHDYRKLSPEEDTATREQERLAKAAEAKRVAGSGSKMLRRQSFKMGDEELLVTALMQTSPETKEALLQTAKFTVDEIAEFTRIIDKKCPDGQIPKDEFVRICTDLYADKIFDIDDYANLVYEIFDVYVNDSVRCIDYHLIQAVQCNGSPAERLQVLFRTMDQDNTGTLTTKDLTTLVRLVNAIGMDENRAGMGSNQLAEMLVIELDTFGTGQVSEADFLSGVISNDALAGVFLGSGDSVSQTLSEGTEWSMASTAVTGVGTAHHDYLGNVVEVGRDRMYTGDYATPDPMDTVEQNLHDPPKKKGWGLRRKSSSPKKKGSGSAGDTQHFYPPDTNATYFE